MEAVCFSSILVLNYETKIYHTPQHNNLQFSKIHDHALS